MLPVSLPAFAHRHSSQSHSHAKPYVPIGDTQTGVASWYGPGFYGHKTSNGETFRRSSLTAAHNSLPLGSLAKVTNLRNHRSVVVRINDRGGFGKYHRLIDLSPKAAKQLRMMHAGVTSVTVIALARSK